MNEPTSKAYLHNGPSWTWVVNLPDGKYISANGKFYDTKRNARADAELVVKLYKAL